MNRTNYEESTMRFAMIGTAATFIVLVSVWVGYAQNIQSSPTPAASPAPAVSPSPESATDSVPEEIRREYETYWPTAAEEAAIPYRPCEIATGWEDRRLICLSTEPRSRSRIAR
jgi:hypothetical protein